MTTIPCPKCKGACLIYSPKGMAPCSRCSGKGTIPAPSKTKPIMIIGEAYGDEEARLGMPFVGASGNQLNLMLEEADIDKTQCYITNVFNLQPKPSNDIKNLGTIKNLSSVPMPEMSKGLYLQDQYFPELKRLWSEIEEVKPNVILALGNTALWALTGTYGIKALRGTVVQSIWPEGFKVIPTYHPAAILRDWSMRPVAIADLMKAKRQARFPEIRRPERQIWLEPDLRDIEYFYHQHAVGAEKISFDIETAGGQITCIGFAVSEKLSLVIPFVDLRKPNGSYWPTAYQEKLAVGWVEKFLHLPAEKVGQNTLYDINWLWHKLGITPKNYSRDTMLKHHALNPELEKSLGFLGSIYTEEPAWKIMRGKGFGTIKRGE